MGSGISWELDDDDDLGIMVVRALHISNVRIDTPPPTQPTVRLTGRLRSSCRCIADTGTELAYLGYGTGAPGVVGMPMVFGVVGSDG